ncbi:hypothetical protein F4803DRAFT_77866 [Xylaria telfairii]|nr:hypothetical protein F4803DRAFT_77866 [Xylaria telfairii]
MQVCREVFVHSKKRNRSLPREIARSRAFDGQNKRLSPRPRQADLLRDRQVDLHGRRRSDVMQQQVKNRLANQRGETVRRGCILGFGLLLSLLSYRTRSRTSAEEIKTLPFLLFLGVLPLRHVISHWCTCLRYIPRAARTLCRQTAPVDGAWHQSGRSHHSRPLICPCAVAKR